MKKSCPTRRGSKEEVEENESEDVSSARWGETIAALDMHVKKRRHTGEAEGTHLMNVKSAWGALNSALQFSFLPASCCCSRRSYFGSSLRQIFLIGLPSPPGCIADCTEGSWKRLLNVSRTGALLSSPRILLQVGKEEGAHDSKNKGPRNDKFAA